MDDGKQSDKKSLTRRQNKTYFYIQHYINKLANTNLYIYIYIYIYKNERNKINMNSFTMSII